MLIPFSGRPAMEEIVPSSKQRFSRFGQTMLRQLAVLAVLYAVPGLATAQVIDFESLHAPGNGTGGLILKNQLSGEGVLFQNATALDFSQGIAIPNFAHSGSAAVEMCYAAEFCTGPLEISFTTAQSRVKLWVGYSYSLESAQTVVLRAYDSLNRRVATATAVLGPSTAVIPVSTPLQVVLPLASIVRVTVGFLGAESTAPTMFNNSLTVDDVEFNVQGGPPVCPSTVPPGVTLLSPVDNSIVVKNEVTVEANLATADPNATLQVTATSPGGTNTFGPVFVASGHVIFANITGLLTAGANTLAVAVKDCFGTTSRQVTVNYRADVKETRIMVIDESNFPVPAAEVYADGVSLGRTNFSGILTVTPPLSDGTTLVARKFVEESSTYRGNHSQGSYQDWKFRVYISNIAVENNGGLTMSSVKLEPDPLAFQVLRVLKKNTLIGLHLVASIEWDASASEMETVKQKLNIASRFLYNATDGQILIEQADIVDDSTYWEDTDIRVYADQSLRENVDCPLGGFFDDSFWCNGSWIHTQINSAGTTYAHEFGHYGFNVDDEYSDDDASVKCTHNLDSATGGFMNNAPAASCMMFWQEVAAKLCSSRPENPHVHGTEQGDDSCWSSLVDKYKDDNDHPRWTLQTPETRSFIPGTINGSNPPLPAWNPRIALVNHARPNLCAPLLFIDTHSDGTPATQDDIWLHTNYGWDIFQGKTDNAGNITATGLHVGDRVENYTIQAADCSPVATLVPRKRFASSPGFMLVSQKTQDRQPSREQIIPPLRSGEPAAPIHLTAHDPKFRVFAALTPVKTGKGAEVRIWAQTLDGKPMTLQQAPSMRIKHVGRSEEMKTAVRLIPQANAYVAPLAGLPLDVEISIEVAAVNSQGQTEQTMARFEMNRVDPEKKTDIFSADGQLQLKLPPQSLTRGSRISIGPAEAPPPKPSSGETSVSGPFRIATDHVGKFAHPATLRFRLPHEKKVAGAASAGPKSFQVLEYNEQTGRWLRRDATVHPFPVDAVTLKIETAGTFALIASNRPAKPEPSPKASSK